MAAYIKLSRGAVRRDVDVTQVGFDLDDTRGAWERVGGVTHYDALTVVCDADRADEVEAGLRADGHTPTNRRPVYAASGPQGDVVHEVHEG